MDVKTIRTASDAAGDILTVARTEGNVLVAISSDHGEEFLTVMLTPSQWADVIAL